MDNKVSQAINIIKDNKDKSNLKFFDAYLLLIVDSLKKGDFDNANFHLKEIINLSQPDRLNKVILESLAKYIYVFKEKKILDNEKKLGKLSSITEAFQRCYLNDDSTDVYFSNLINDLEADYSRYIFFYLTYLIENNRFENAREITDNLD